MGEGVTVGAAVGATVAVGGSGVGDGTAVGGAVGEAVTARSTVGDGATVGDGGRATTQALRETVKASTDATSAARPTGSRGARASWPVNQQIFPPLQLQLSCQAQGQPMYQETMGQQQSERMLGGDSTNSRSKRTPAGLGVSTAMFGLAELGDVTLQRSLTSGDLSPRARGE